MKVKGTVAAIVVSIVALTAALSMLLIATMRPAAAASTPTVKPSSAYLVFTDPDTTTSTKHVLPQVGNPWQAKGIDLPQKYLVADQRRSEL